MHNAKNKHCLYLWGWLKLSGSVVVEAGTMWSRVAGNS